MTVSIESAAKYVGECSDWKVSNLALQKILYIADLVYLGRYGHRLTDADFEAWDYGPVSPRLYRKLKGYGAQPIPASALWAAPDVSPASPEGVVLKEASDHLARKSGSDLIRNTHWKGGAWAKRYVPGANVEITEADMLDEFKGRSARSASAA